MWISNVWFHSIFSRSVVCLFTFLCCLGKANFEFQWSAIYQFLLLWLVLSDGFWKEENSIVIWITGMSFICILVYVKIAPLLCINVQEALLFWKYSEFCVWIGIVSIIQPCLNANQHIVIGGACFVWLFWQFSFLLVNDNVPWKELQFPWLCGKWFFWGLCFF